MKLPNKALATLLLLTAGCSNAPITGSTGTTTNTTVVPNLQPFTDTTGDIATYTTAADILESNPFFSALGSNTRSCANCHQLSQGMSISAAAATALFNSTNGTDPLFDAVDGANCPTATTGNAAQHSLILNNGLIRITVTLPTTAQFKLTVLSDPYGCAVTTNTSGQQVVSVYRRPLPSSNLSFLSAVMWDTRETTSPLSTLATFPANLTADLNQQALDAITEHEQGLSTPSAPDITALVAFEQGLFTAQITDSLAGSLSSNGATGGPAALASTNYYPGINDSLGNDPTGAKFNPASMTLYTTWHNSANTQQASIERGEQLFNTAPMNITNVNGLPGTVPHASCSFCHDTPDIGNRSVFGALDTGTAHNTAAETDPNVIAGLARLSVPSLPLYQITGCKINGTAVTYTTSDPGRALSTGLCADMNYTKVPILRGLAARAPYFHGGSAASLAQVVAFYNARFQMGLTTQQQTDLVNFLNAL
jgi:cytochrome c peroxidase